MPLRKAFKISLPLMAAAALAILAGVAPQADALLPHVAARDDAAVSAQRTSRPAAAALMGFYHQGTGLWTGTGWWNAANDMTALLDLDRLGGTHDYVATAANTYDKQLNRGSGQFRNNYLDDTGWWGLAWIRAYDLTGDQRYLDTARTDADWMWSYWDGTCGGGIWWSTAKTYKNAIPNEVFLKLATELHNRMPGDTTYLDHAEQEWHWFAASGMINSQHLVNDGLTSGTCQNNGQTTWTYNQGVILGGLLELNRATGDTSLIDTAGKIATAATQSSLFAPNGILTEPCEANGGDDCQADGPSFKGIFARNLGELNRAMNGHPFTTFLQNQATSLTTKDRNSSDQYGLHWAGPFDKADPARQHSALDALTAAAWPGSTQGCGAAGGGSGGSAGGQTYQAHGYAYTDQAPVPGANLIHVKIREGHEHTLEFKSFGPNNCGLVDDYKVKAREGYNAWYDPTKVSTVQITISDQPPITVRIDGYHCYYEDKQGTLQPATDRPCTPN
jgi:predicted alpha-1,6-mannanase (GH76 family)